MTGWAKLLDDAHPLIYAAIALLLMLPLLSPGYYVTLDMQFGPNTFAEKHFWSFYGMGGTAYGASLPLSLLHAALSDAFSVEVAEKLLLFLMLAFCGISAHRALPRELGPSRYFAGLLYTLNPFVFLRFVVGHWYILIAYACFPLALRLFRDFLKRPGDFRKLADVALITMPVAVSSHMLILLFACYALLFALHLLANGISVPLLRRSALLAAAVFAMNVFWLVPTASVFEERYSIAPPEGSMEDFNAIPTGNISLEYSLLSMHGFWRQGYQYTKDISSLWQAPFAIIALLALIGLAALLKKDRWLALFFVIVFASGFLLALGIKGPLSWLYLSSPISGFLSFAFRDTQKFVSLLALAYSMMGAYGVHFIVGRLSALKLPKAIPAAVPVAVSAAFLLLLLAVPIVYNYGFFGFLNQVGTTQYPAGWAAAEAVMSADSVPGAILFLPLHHYMPYPWINATVKTAAMPASQFFTRQVVSLQNIEMRHVYADTASATDQYISYLFQNSTSRPENNLAARLLPMNVRYVMLLHEGGGSAYAHLFRNKTGMELVLENRDMLLFRNNLAQGPFFATTDAGSGGFGGVGSGSVSAGAIAYDKVTPASYRILSAPAGRIVFAAIPSPLPVFEGAGADPWHKIASSFTFSGPGVLEYPMFYPVLAFQLLSWSLIFICISGSPKRAAPFVFVPALGVFFLTSAGAIGVHLFGAIMLLSIVAAVAMRFGLIEKCGAAARHLLPA